MLDHALQQLGASRWCLRRELASPREHRLHVGSGRLLATDLGQVDSVVKGQDRLVICPEGTQVEAGRAEVVVVLKPLSRVRVRVGVRLRLRVRVKGRVRVRVAGLGQSLAAKLLELLDLRGDLEVKQ